MRRGWIKLRGLSTIHCLLCSSVAGADTPADFTAVPRFQGLAANALESIGGVEAARLLLDALNRVDCLAATGIFHALMSMRPDLVETPLVAEIDLALAGAQERTEECLKSLGFTK